MKIPSLDNLHIVYYPDGILKRVCEPVESFGPELQNLADRMLALMHTGEGLGLAAPQVGVAIRLFVCNLTGEPEDDAVYVNPKLSDLQGATEEPEGCLSIPEVDVTMRRSTGATIEAVDAAGNPIRRESQDLTARVWQHEMDHLDGRLITDNMSSTDEIANRRALKQLEADFAESPRRRSSSRCESSS
ncbi:MAG: peptide deformylase [Planctomycetes bacterium]|nr:peptide deformylase [Planctomycetota bacterium]